MALFTYLIAFGHFSSELLIFRTAKINPALLSPVIVSCEFVQPIFVALKMNVQSNPEATSLIWMLSQYDFYVKA
jgi:hypothetical protein